MALLISLYTILFNFGQYLTMDLEDQFLPRIGESKGWIFGLISLQVVLYAWVKLNFPKRFELLVNAYISNRFVSQLSREEQSSQGLYNFILELNYLISFSLFVYLVNANFEMVLQGYSGLVQYIILLLCTLLLILLKNLVMRLLVWVFDMKDMFFDIYFYRFLGHAVLSIALIPCIVFVVYSNHYFKFWLILGIASLGLAFMYRLIRSALRFWTMNSFSIKYIILYICALEILPLCVFIKLAIA